MSGKLKIPQEIPDNLFILVGKGHDTVVQQYILIHYLSLSLRNYLYFMKTQAIIISVYTVLSGLLTKLD